MQKTQVRSLSLEDPLEKGIATHSSRIPMPIESPWTEEPGGLQSMESQRVGHDWSDLAHSTVLDTYPHFYTQIFFITLKTKQKTLYLWSNRYYFLFPLPSQFLVTSILLSLSMNLPFLGSLYRWNCNHICLSVPGFFHVFKFHPCCDLY